MPNYYLDLEVNRVDLVDEGANSEAHIKLFKRKEPTKMTFEEIIAKMKPEHAEVVKAAFADSNSKVDTLTTELAKTKEDLVKVTEEVAKFKEPKVQPEVSTEEVIKGLDPKVQEIFKSITAQKEAAETIAKQLNDEKVEKAAIEKAKELKNIPVEEAKLVEVAKSASPELFEVLKAASNAIDTKVLKSVGSSNEGTTGADAWTQIEKKAETMAEAESITKQKAIAKVIKAEPKLYAEYLKGGNQ